MKIQFSADHAENCVVTLLSRKTFCQNVIFFQALVVKEFVMKSISSDLTIRLHDFTISITNAFFFIYDKYIRCRCSICSINQNSICPLGSYKLFFSFWISYRERSFLQSFLVCFFYDILPDESLHYWYCWCFWCVHSDIICI